MKRAALLHYAGEWLFDIFFNLRDPSDDADYDLAVAALKGYFSP